MTISPSSQAATTTSDGVLACAWTPTAASVPDSEDEESGVEMEASGVEGADLGGSSVTMNGMQMAAVGVPADAIAAGADGVMVDGIDVVAEGVYVGVVKVAAERSTADGINVAADDEEMHPKVAARLKMLLAHVYRTFHDIFISIYKVMVPAFFIP